MTIPRVLSRQLFLEQPNDVLEGQWAKDPLAEEGKIQQGDFSTPKSYRLAS